MIKAPGESQSLSLRGLRVECIIGVHEKERQVAQPLVVDLVLRQSDGRAFGDDIDQVVDYQELVEKISQVLLHGKFQLIERAAQAVADAVEKSLTHDAKFLWESMDVCVAKPEALGGQAVPAFTLSRRIAHPSHR